MRKLTITTIAVLAFTASAYATYQQGGNSCYTRCWTDAAGVTHCTTTCN